MFERYTEGGRRVLFRARYEATQLGSISIETEHLFLGLIHEEKGLTSRIFRRSDLSLDEAIRKEIRGRTVCREKVSRSVASIRTSLPSALSRTFARIAMVFLRSTEEIPIPFSEEAKRVLQHAADEAKRLMHDYIGPEHLLLGTLREEQSVAATLLMDKGMRLASVREDIAHLLNEKTT